MPSRLCGDMFVHKTGRDLHRKGFFALTVTGIDKTNPTMRQAFLLSV